MAWASAPPDKSWLHSAFLQPRGRLLNPLNSRFSRPAPERAHWLGLVPEPCQSRLGVESGAGFFCAPPCPAPSIPQPQRFGSVGVSTRGQHKRGVASTPSCSFATESLLRTQSARVRVLYSKGTDSRRKAEFGGGKKNTAWPRHCEWLGTGNRVFEVALMGLRSLAWLQAVVQSPLFLSVTATLEIA